VLKVCLRTSQARLKFLSLSAKDADKLLVSLASPPIVIVLAEEANNLLVLIWLTVFNGTMVQQD
jgi:hypothetical protein